MNPPGRPFVRTLREALQRAVDAGSLRSVAKQVGMSPMGLRAFLNGGTPRRSTEESLRKWYVEHGASGPGEMSAETARICAELLLVGVPEAKREGAVRELMDALREIHRRREVRPPGWAAAPKENDPGG